MRISTCTTIRVRTGYGILEKLWNFEKEIPYMEKLWNLSKMAVPMEKIWNFRVGEKKCVLSVKNGGKIRPDFNVCCFGYHFTRHYKPPGLWRWPQPNEYLLVLGS